MKAKTIELLGRLLDSVFNILPDRKLVQVVYNIILHRVKSRSAIQALRFLFDLDTRLYHLQGQMAIDYDGGIHSKHRLMNYHDFFIKRVSANDRVLDIGCGIGAVAYDVAKDTGAFVVGIDINAENIRIAKERYQHSGLEFRIGDALKTLPNENFSLVILSNVLEHLPGRPSFLRRVQEVIKPGRYLIRVPLFERDWRVPLKKEIGVEWRLDSTHEIEYTLEAFASEMQEAGLTVKHLEVRWGEIWAELFPSK
jgi:SAM-dependent methyltransferase